MLKKLMQFSSLRHRMLILITDHVRVLIEKLLLANLNRNVSVNVYIPVPGIPGLAVNVDR